jgi:hypothetical protein
VAWQKPPMQAVIEYTPLDGFWCWVWCNDFFTSQLQIFIAPNVLLYENNSICKGLQDFRNFLGLSGNLQSLQSLHTQYSIHCLYTLL